MNSFTKINNNKIFKLLNVSIIGILFLTMTIFAIFSITSNSIHNSSWFDIVMNKWFWISLSTYTILIPGFKYFKVYKLIIKRKIHMDILLALAIHISYIFSLVVLLIDYNNEIIVEPIGLLYAFDTVGKDIENSIAKKNDHERASLESLVSKEVMLQNKKMVKIEDVKVGDIVMIHEGDVIQFDGTIHSGIPQIDMSNINGESKLKQLKSGSQIISGSKLIKGMFMLKVTKIYNDSTLNNLIKLVTKANNNKPKIQQFTDKVFNIFLPSVLLISIITLISWIILGNTTNIIPYVADSNKEIYNSFFITVSVLAIACPCAMTMATPLVNYIAAQGYWRNNILFNDITVIEEIPKITHIVLDKTGTITTNEMQIIQHFGTKHEISAALEEKFYHPIANAIYSKFSTNKKYSITSLKEIKGKGIEAKILKNNYFIGRVDKLTIEKTFKNKIEDGTYVGLFENKKLIAAYVLTSALKPNAKYLIEQLKLNNIIPIILTGDNEEATIPIAKMLDIEYKHSQTPEDKAEYIKQLQSKGFKVLMVGDGANDSIALKVADVSASFTSGSLIANNYASISLLTDDLKNIIYLMKLSKSTKRHYRLAVLWAISFNVLLVPVAAIGFIYPWLSAIIMYTSNIILYVVLYLFSMKLRRHEINVYGHKTKTKVKANHSNMENMSMGAMCH